MKKLQILLAATLFLVFSLVSFQAAAQCGTFDDSPEGEDGMVAHTLYRDEVKAKNFEAAYENWRKAYTIAPAANGKNYLHYSDGRKILKALLEKEADAAKKQAYTDEILSLYDQQIQCYGTNGQEGYLLGRKGFDMFYYYRNFIGEDTKVADAAILETLKSCIDKGGNDVEYITLVPYASVVVNQFAAEKLDKAGARAVYDQLNKIADHNIANNAKNAENFKKTKESMNGTFATIEGHIFDCAYFVEKTRPVYEANPDDPANIEACIRKLKRRGCDASEPLLAELEGKYAKYASAENARRKSEFEANNPAHIAKGMYDAGDYKGAITKYEEAISLESDPNKKASILFSIASIQGRKLKSYSTARTTARKAAELRGNWGRPFMLIGDLYASSARNCGDSWNQRLAVLAAIDKYAYARSIDPSVADEASKKIGRYAASKPEKTEGFMRGVKAGQSAKVGCWIGETVKVSFK